MFNWAFVNFTIQLIHYGVWSIKLMILALEPSSNLRLCCTIQLWFLFRRSENIARTCNFNVEQFSNDFNSFSQHGHNWKLRHIALWIQCVMFDSLWHFNGISNLIPEFWMETNISKTVQIIRGIISLNVFKLYVKQFYAWIKLFKR